MYTVIGPVQSRTLRVIWMLEELGQPYDHVPALPQSDSVVQINPAGKVPVLIYDGTPITDLTAIMTFLADRHGKMTLSQPARWSARQDSLTQFLLDEFDAALWLAARHSFVLPEELRLSAIKNTLRWEFEKSQKQLIHRMGEGDFVIGDQMTVPDIILAHCLIWALTAKFRVIEPRLSKFLAQMRERPAFRRAVAE